jgi:prepilin-type N-terminal cleavage/methylation domain-containing protein
MFKYIKQSNKSFTLTPLDNSASQNRFIRFFKKNLINLSNGVNRTKSFTLIELLIVIAILALLMSIIIITLNPSEILKQTRDTKRISNLKSLNNALSIFQATKPTTSTGTAYIVYISIPDSSSTCANLSLPTLPDGYTYQCSTVANYRKTDGTGWIPVNFDSLDIGSPLSSLPIDPTNTTSTGLYLTYVTGGSWEMRAQLESEGQEQAINDGDAFPGLYSVGTTLNLTPAMRDRGLVGYWDFEEGSGSIAYDRSGNSNNGTWNGSGAHYTAGKVGTYSASFNGTDDFILRSYTASLSFGINNSFTITGWININDYSGFPYILERYGQYEFRVDNTGKMSGVKIFENGNRCRRVGSTAINVENWYFVTIVGEGISCPNIYLNSLLETTSGSPDVASYSAQNNLGIGRRPNSASSYWTGEIDDLRIYNRVLTASEIKAIYEGTK